MTKNHYKVAINRLIIRSFCIGYIKNIKFSCMSQYFTILSNMFMIFMRFPWFQVQNHPKILSFSPCTRFSQFHVFALFYAPRMISPEQLIRLSSNFYTWSEYYYTVFWLGYKHKIDFWENYNFVLNYGTDFCVKNNDNFIKKKFWRQFYFKIKYPS